MTLFWWIYGAALLAVWSGVAAYAIYGVDKLADITRPEWDPTSTEWPRVTVIVPAKDEARDIAGCLRSLVECDYPRLEMIAVDDRSTDGTCAIMRDFAAQHPGKLRAIEVRELPAGWMGKTHAMHLAQQQARGEWLLFTDADVIFRADAIRRAVAAAERLGADHLVVLPTILLHTVGESAAAAFMQTMITPVARLWKVPDPKSSAAVGAGAFNMVERSAYEATGGFSTIRAEVVEDLELGVLLKKNGFVTHVVLGHGLISLRWLHGAMGVLRNLTKNLFAVMKYRPTWALASIIGIAIGHIGPWVGLVAAPGLARLCYAGALLAVLTMYVALRKHSRISPVYAIAQPLMALLVMATVANSVLSYYRHGGVVWRGTVYRMDELRKHAASAQQK